MFRSVADTAYEEILDREGQSQEQLSFGVKFLDDALRGILRDDMVLVGAGSGIGKTQLICNIALANLALNKRVHLFALESSKYEIERRLKYPLVAERYFGDPDISHQLGLNYVEWTLGKFRGQITPYEKEAANYFKTAYKNLFVYEHSDRFTVNDLIEGVLQCESDTDLVIVDHAHYFDFDGDENSALKLIAKTVRTLAIEMRKPIVVVAHLRKRDRSNDELAPSMEEFHGSSDLYKIATKVITIAPGIPTTTGHFETFFRIPKNRIDGTVTRFLGQCFFDPKRGSYHEGYKVGWAEQRKGRVFQEVPSAMRPKWATVGAVPVRSDHHRVPEDL